MSIRVRENETLYLCRPNCIGGRFRRNCIGICQEQRLCFLLPRRSSLFSQRSDIGSSKRHCTTVRVGFRNKGCSVCLWKENRSCLKRAVTVCTSVCTMLFSHLNCSNITIAIIYEVKGVCVRHCPANTAQGSWLYAPRCRIMPARVKRFVVRIRSASICQTCCSHRVDQPRCVWSWCANLQDVKRVLLFKRSN